MGLRIAFLLVLLCSSVVGARNSKTLQIYIDNDGTFAVIPLSPDQGRFAADSLDELIPFLSEKIGETLPQEVVLFAGEDITLNTILRVVNLVETSSPKTKIRIVTSASYKKRPILREFVVTPLK